MTLLGGLLGPRRQPAIPPAETPGRESVQDPLLRYRAYIAEKTAFLSLKGLLSGHVPQIELKHVYISLKATSGDVTESSNELNLSRSKPERAAPPGNKTLLLDTSFFNQSHGGAARLSLEKVLRDSRRVVILGEPGSGKSTFVRYVCSRVLAEPELYRTILKTNGTPLPLLVQARSLDLNTLGDRRDLIHAAIPDALRKDLPTDLLLAELDAGCCLVILDGLDEIPEIRKRKQAAKWMEELAATCHPQTRFLVTSRIAGYRDAPLESSFVRYTLCGFDTEDIRSFIRRWYEVVVTNSLDARVRAWEASLRVERLLHVLENQPQIRQLARNPLLLTIILLVYTERQQLPKDRAELYHQCVDVLLEHLQQAKSEDGPSLPSSEHVDYLRLDQRRELLKRSARWMHQLGVTEAPRRDLLEAVIWPLLEDMGRSPDIASQLLDQIEGVTGLLITKSSSIGFPHLAFQEYLTALALTESSDHRELLKFLYDVQGKSWWREVICIYSSLLADSSELVCTIMSSPDTPLKHSLLLAAACVSEARLVSMRVRTEVVERLAEVYANPATPFLRTLAKEMLISIGGTAVQSLCERLLLEAGGDVPRLLDAIELQARIAGRPTVAKLITFGADRTFPERIRIAAIRGIKTARYLPAEGELILASLIWSTEDGPIRNEAIATLGSFPIGSQTSDKVRGELIGIRSHEQLDGVYVSMFKAFASVLLADEALDLFVFCVNIPGHAEYKVELCRGLLKLRCEETTRVDLLLGILRSGSDWGARGGAALVLAMSVTRREEIASALAESLLRDRDIGTSSRVAEALAHLGWKDEKVLSALLTVLNGERHSPTRWKLVEAYAVLTQDEEFIDKHVVSTFAPTALASESSQLSALDVLDQVQFRSKVLSHQLIAVLESSSTHIANRIVMYLARNGLFTTSSGPTLRAKLRAMTSNVDGDLILRDRAAEALFYIEMAPEAIGDE